MLALGSISCSTSDCTKALVPFVELKTLIS